MKKEKPAIYIMLIGKIVAWCFGIAVIIMLLLKITEHSPTMDQIILSLLGTMLISMISVGFMVGKRLGKMENDITHLTRMFYALARDFKNHAH